MSGILPRLFRDLEAAFTEIFFKMRIAVVFVFTGTHKARTVQQIGQSHQIILDKGIDIWENKVAYYISCLKGAANAREATNDYGTFFCPD